MFTSKNTIQYVDYKENVFKSYKAQKHLKQKRHLHKSTAVYISENCWSKGFERTG